MTAFIFLCLEKPFLNHAEVNHSYRYQSQINRTITRRGLTQSLRRHFGGVSVNGLTFGQKSNGEAFGQFFRTAVVVFWCGEFYQVFHYMSKNGILPLFLHSLWSTTLSGLQMTRYVSPVERKHYYDKERKIGGLSVHGLTPAYQNCVGSFDLGEHFGAFPFHIYS